VRTVDHRATHCFVGVTMRVRVREDEACGALHIHEDTEDTSINLLTYTDEHAAIF